MERLGIRHQVVIIDISANRQKWVLGKLNDYLLKRRNFVFGKVFFLATWKVAYFVVFPGKISMELRDYH